MRWRVKFYIASKIRHAARWQRLRKAGYDIVSSWIDHLGDEPDEGKRGQAWRMIADIGAADVLIVYCEPQEVLKGALIEVGAALALKKPICWVGPTDAAGRVFPHSHLITIYDSVEAALAR